MRFTLSIECNNAAFGGEKLIPEVVRILKQAADDVDTNSTMILRDINGNMVGEYNLY